MNELEWEYGCNDSGRNFLHSSKCFSETLRAKSQPSVQCRTTPGVMCGDPMSNFGHRYRETVPTSMIWGFPKIRGTFLGVPIVRIIVFWGLYWGALI